MEILIRTPGGEVSYDVPVMKVKTYSIEEIFEKKLLFLIPFYIFTYENRFAEIENSSDELEALTGEYQGIRGRLDQLATAGSIDEYYKITIMDMSERVLANLAEKYEKIRKGVGSVVSGQVLDYEAKRIKNEGRMEKSAEDVRNLMETMSITAKKAMDALKIPEGERAKVLSIL